MFSMPCHQSCLRPSDVLEEHNVYRIDPPLDVISKLLGPINRVSIDIKIIRGTGDVGLFTACSSLVTTCFKIVRFRCVSATQIDMSCGIPTAGFCCVRNFVLLLGNYTSLSPILIKTSG